MRHDKEIRFRLTSDEKAALINLAQKKNLSQSDYVRHLISRGAGKRDRLPFSSKKGIDSKSRAIRLNG